MNEIQAEENPLSQDFDIKSLLKCALPTIVMMLLMKKYSGIVYIWNGERMCLKQHWDIGI